MLWDTPLKVPKKDAKDQKLAAIKELEEHFGFKFSGSELVVFLTYCPPYLSSRSLGSSVASNVALKSSRVTYRCHNKIALKAVSCNMD